MLIASLYKATEFDRIASTIMVTARILSRLVAIAYGSLQKVIQVIVCSIKCAGEYNKRGTFSYLSTIIAGKMKPIRTAAVAPVNWNASQMLGIKMAAR
jgi:hypothetical protein